jgi:hypothetical protein
MDLLNYIQYVPTDRDQLNCGNCWVWAGTGVMEIANSMKDGILDRLSVQFLNSCKTDHYVCCGGDLSAFAAWYGGKGFAIPWSNTNASFADMTRRCSDGSSIPSCGSISINPDYPINYIQAQTIPTTGIGSSTAINNIKNILNQNKGIYFGFCLADSNDWNEFLDFWRGVHGETEATLWNTDNYCGHQWNPNPNEGACHAVVIVGYNDDDPNPANHYWIVLNSWGTAGGVRPNGLFRMPIQMNYDCFLPDPPANTSYNARQFQTLDVQFDTLPPNGTVSRYLSATNTSDTWQFTISSDGKITFSLTFNNTLYIHNLHIYDSDGASSIANCGGTLGGIGSSPATCGPYGLKAGTYYVNIDRSGGYGGYTLGNTYTATDTTPPLAPISLSATPSSWTNTNSFAIDWTNPTDPSGIAGAYYKLGSAPTSNTDGIYTTSKPFIVGATAQAGQDIYVWLKDGAGNTSYLNRSSTTLYYDGTAPTDGTLTAAPSDAQVSLNWSAFSDNGGSGLRSTNTYKVVRNTGDYPNNQCTNGTQVYLGNGSSATDVGLTNGTTYYYRACAYDNAGNISLGTTASAIPQPGYLGDINGDSKVDISDVILVLRIALKLDSLKPCSDINGDDTVDISDVILTLRMALGLDQLKPCTG